MFLTVSRAVVLSDSPNAVFQAPLKPCRHRKESTKTFLSTTEEAKQSCGSVRDRFGDQHRSRGAMEEMTHLQDSRLG